MRHPRDFVIMVTNGYNITVSRDFVTTLKAIQGVNKFSPLVGLYLYEVSSLKLVIDIKHSLLMLNIGYAVSIYSFRTLL